MLQRRIPFLKGNFYHIFSRGDRKEKIFYEEENYLRFLTKAEEYRVKYKMGIVAYCLLTNHLHLLIQQLENLSISRFMADLTNSHARFLAVKYQLPPGHVFQGRFGATHLESETDFLQASRYIHLNPIKDEILSLDFTSEKSKSLQRLYLIEKLRTYPWSSYRHYLDQADNPVTIHDQPILELEKSKTEYQKFVESKIRFDDFLNLERF